MADLAEFLLARIAEDEDDPIGWHRVECNTVATAAVIRIKGWTGASYSLECDCGGIARQEAECEAKRRIIAVCRGYEGEHINAGGYRLVLVALAAPYSDHPDFDTASSSASVDAISRARGEAAAWADGEARVRLSDLEGQT